MIVVDASVIVAILTHASTAAVLSSRLFGQGDTPQAPHLIDVEVMSVIRRMVLARAMTADRAEQSIAGFIRMPIERYSHELLIERIWYHRENLTAYDAAYVALAEILDTFVLTTDAKLARAPGMSRRVKLVV